MKSSLKDRSLGIDLLRCLSLLLVVFNHYGVTKNFFLSGTHGVVIFFMVSGFCMAYSMQNRTGAQFLSARFWRLVPTLVICVTLSEIVEATFSSIIPDRGQSFSHYLANLSCLPLGNLFCDAVSDFLRGSHFNYSWVDGAYWSLLVEIRFYLLLWMVCYLLKVKHSIFLIATLGLLAPLGLEWNKISKSSDFFIYLPFFSFGMAYGVFRREGIRGILLMVYCFVVFVFISVLGSQAISMTLDKYNVFSYGSCFLIFILCMFLFREGQNKAVSYLGILSYPFYLLHQDMGLIFLRLLEDKPSYFSIPFVFVGILLLAAAVQRFIDLYQPIVRSKSSQLFLKR